MNIKNISIKASKVILWLFFLLATIFFSGKLIDIQSTLRVPATLGNLFVFTDLWDKGYFNATGTWNSGGEKRIDKLNSVEITCSLPRKMCAVSVASINQYGEGKPFLSTSLDIFDIVRWDSQVINFKEEKQCAETYFSINRETKTVSALRKYFTTVSGCSPDNTKEVKYSLVNGFEIYLELLNENNSGYALFIFIATLSLAITIFGIYRVFKKSS